LAVTQKYAIQADEIRAKFADDRAKAEIQASNQRQKDLEDQIKKEKEIEEIQKKRFDDLYNAEIKAQEQNQKRLDAALKAEKELLEKLAKLREEYEKAKEKLPEGNVGKPGNGRPEVPGITITPGALPSSAETGAQKQAQAAYIKGLKESAEALREYVRNQLRANGAVHDNDAVNRKLIDIQKERAYEEGKAKYGIKEFLDGVKKAKENLLDFERETKDTSQSLVDFSSSLSELQPAFDQTLKSASNLADSITKNSGDMVKNFLETAQKTNDLGKDFFSLGESSNRLSDQLDQIARGDTTKGGGKDKDKNLGDIYQLLDDNLKEMRTYVFVK